LAGNKSDLDEKKLEQKKKEIIHRKLRKKTYGEQVYTYPQLVLSLAK
jgi:hypothetical protein